MLAEAQAWTGWGSLGTSSGVGKEISANGDSVSVIPVRADLCPACAKGLVAWWRAKP